MDGWAIAGEGVRESPAVQCHADCATVLTFCSGRADVRRLARGREPTRERKKSEDITITVRISHSPLTAALRILASRIMAPPRPLPSDMPDSPTALPPSSLHGVHPPPPPPAMHTKASHQHAHPQPPPQQAQQQQHPIRYLVPHYPSTPAPMSQTRYNQQKAAARRRSVPLPPSAGAFMFAVSPATPASAAGVALSSSAQQQHPIDHQHRQQQQQVLPPQIHQHLHIANSASVQNAIDFPSSRGGSAAAAAAAATTSALQLQQLEFFRPQGAADYGHRSAPPARGASAAAAAGLAVPGGVHARRPSHDPTLSLHQLAFITQSLPPSAKLAHAHTLHHHPDDTRTVKPGAREKGSSEWAVDKNGEPCRAAPAVAPSSSAATPRAHPAAIRSGSGSSSASPAATAAGNDNRAPIKVSFSTIPPPLPSGAKASVMPTPMQTPNPSTPGSPIAAALQGQSTPPAAAALPAPATTIRIPANAKQQQNHSPSSASPWAPTLPPAILQSRNPISRDEFMKVLDAHVAAEKAAAAAALAASGGSGKNTVPTTTTPALPGETAPPPALTIQQPGPELVSAGKRKWDEFAAAHEVYVRQQQAVQEAEQRRRVRLRTGSVAAAVTPAPVAVPAPAVAEEEELTAGFPHARAGDDPAVFAKRLDAWLAGVSARVIKGNARASQ